MFVRIYIMWVASPCLFPLLHDKVVCYFLFWWIPFSWPLCTDLQVLDQIIVDETYLSNEPYIITISWWRHQMETFPVSLALCAGNAPVTGEFPTRRPVTRSFDEYDTDLSSAYKQNASNFINGCYTPMFKDTWELPTCEGFDSKAFGLKQMILSFSRVSMEYPKNY